MSKIIQSRLIQCLRAHTDAPAVEAGDTVITYSLLSQRASALCRWLTGRAVPEHTLIGIYTRDKIDLAVAIIGILFARCVFVPLDPQLPVNRLKAMVRHSGTRILLTDADGAEKLSGIKTESGEPVIIADLQAVSSGAAAFDTLTLRQAQPDDPVYIYFTSGTSGIPRAVLGRNKSLRHLILWEIETLRVIPGTRVSQFSAAGFDAFLRDMFVPLCSGGTMCIPPNPGIVTDGRELVPWIDSRLIEIIHCVPSIFRLILSESLSPRFFKSLRYILMAGETLDPRFPASWHRVFGDRVQLVNCYGTTETTMFKTTYFIPPGDVKENNGHRKKIPAGLPVKGARIVVMDKHMNLCGRGNYGEIYIRTPYASLGYCNNPELTARLFLSNPVTCDPRDIFYRTGDTGRLMPDGLLEVKGRADRQVNIRGQRIEPGDIEHFLLSHQDIREAVVVPRALSGNDSEEKELCGYVVCTEPTGLDLTAALREFLSRFLPRHMVPMYFTRLEKMPLTPNGKIDLRRLPPPRLTDLNEVEKPEVSSESPGETAKTLAAIWTDVLDIEPGVISNQSNFFQLGGHSLKAAIMLSKAAGELNVKIPLAEVFRSQTLGQLAEAADRLANEPPRVPDRTRLTVEPVETRDYYPLSPAQERVFFMDKLQNRGTAFNIPMALRINGQWDKDQCQKALNTLVRRHETLRTFFQLLENEPVQRVRPIESVKVSIETITGDYMDFIRPFDLSGAPLLRMGIKELGNREFILVLDMHHIISDGTSLGILLDELLASYRLDGELPAPAIQYKDYVFFQHRLMYHPVFQSQLQYWTQCFPEPRDIPVLSLPLDYPRPPVFSFQGHTFAFQLDDELTHAIKVFISSHDLTLYLILQTALTLLFHCSTCHQDIVTGCGVTGRNHDRLHGIVGMFVNALPIRLQVSEKQRILDFIRIVKDTCLSAFENQDVPFEYLVENLHPPRDPSRHPFFDVSLLVQNFYTPDLPDGSFEVRPVILKRTNVKNGLTFFAEEFTRNGSHHIHFRIEYCTSLLKESTIQRMAGHFKHILHQITAEPSIRISEIELLTAKEKQQILVDFNATSTDFPPNKTVLDLFEEQMEQTPDTIAVIGRPETKKGDRQKSTWQKSTSFPTSYELRATSFHLLTYRELNNQANLFATELQNQGASPETIVALIMERSAELAAAILGVMKCGAIFLPMDPVLPGERVKFVLCDSGAGFVLDTDLHRLKEDFHRPGGARTPKRCKEKRGQAPNIDPAYIIYTSGSTGKPKGVVIKHSGLFNTISWRKREYNMGKKHRALLQLSPGFDAFYSVFFTALVSGACVVMVSEEEKTDLAALKTIIGKHQITHFTSTPSLYETIMDISSETDLKTLQTITLGGEKFTQDLLTKSITLNKNTEIINEYGPTESTIIATFARYKKPGQKITIGKPIANTHIYIITPRNHPAPVGIPGEICISGPGVAEGYLNRPGLTAGVFLDTDLHRLKKRTYTDGFVLKDHLALYKSGDVGRWLENGEIEFLGRIDRQVKVNGIRVELGEIEFELLRCDGVNDAVVVFRDGGLLGFVVLSGVSIGEVREYLLEKIPAFMVPGRLIEMDVLPRTVSGKIDAGSLPVDVETKEESKDDAPVNEIEKTIAGIFEELLGLEKGTVKRRDDFFLLGGHSLKAMLLAARLQDEFDINIPLQEIFRMPTVQGLAGFVDGVGEDRRFYHSLEPVEKRDYYPLSPAQKRVFFFARLEGVGIAYNMPHLFVMRGEPDIQRLETAFGKVIERHALLRSSFHLAGQEPVQRIHEQVAFKILRDRAWNSPKEIFRGIVVPFDLTGPPLFRVGVSPVTGGGCFFMFDIHHIIADGTSMGVLIDDVLGFYMEDGHRLPRLSIQYHDYAVWQTRELVSRSFKHQEQYWLERFDLGHEIPVLDFPLDFPRPPVFDFRGDEYRFVLPVEHTAAVKALAERTGTTLFMVLLAAFGTLLYRYTGQKDIIVGTGTMGRRHTALQGLIGMFVNTLALRIAPEPFKSFQGFLIEIKSTVIDALEHQDYPFEDLVEQLAEHSDTGRDPSRNPLFDMMLVVQNVEQAKGSLDTIRLEPLELEKKHTKFDLGIYAVEKHTEKGDVIEFAIEYAVALFKKEKIQSAAGHFIEILGKAAREPGILLGDIEYLSDDEKITILEEFSGILSVKPVINTLHGLFEERATEAPDRVAVVGCGLGEEAADTITLSYKELNARANRIAHFLAGLQTHGQRGSGPVVGVWIESSVDQAAAVLGVLKAGAAYLPFDPGLPRERVKWMIDDSALGVMVSQMRFKDQLEILQWECPRFHTSLTVDASYPPEQRETGELMDRELWDYVGRRAVDDITAGGWTSSFTGLPFSKQEMDEYGENVKQKLEYFLFSDTKILEIGCASGLTMFKLAPLVKEYWGTDLSQVILERNRERMERDSHSNIHLKCLAAHDIDQLGETDFDVVIINSVIQCFPGYDYLRTVIREAVDLIGESGYLFIGDIMDLDLKSNLVHDLEMFKKENRGKGFTTKTDFSNELFFSRGFWEDLSHEIDGLERVSCSEKRRTVENELTRYRYDALITVNKNNTPSAINFIKHKHRFDGSVLERQPASNPGLPIEPDHWAYVIYTSGSTGKPKGTVVKHLSGAGLLADPHHFVTAVEDDRVIQASSFSFDASVYNYFTALVNGAALILPRETAIQEVHQLVGLIEKENVSVYLAITAIFNTIIDQWPEKVKNVTKLMMGGEAASVTHTKKALELYGPNRLINLYGPTETTVLCTAYPINDINDLTTTVPIGKPITNAAIYIVDPKMNPVPVGVTGEIIVTGTCVAEGYLNRVASTFGGFFATDGHRPPAQTDTDGIILKSEVDHENTLETKVVKQHKSTHNKSFAGGPGGPSRTGFIKQKRSPYATRSRRQSFYKTGDMGCWLDGGNIEFRGRRDLQVKVRGHRVELGELEERLKGMVGVCDAVVEALTDDTGGSVLCGYVVGDEGVVLDVEELRVGLGRVVSSYMVPSFIVQLERLPVTANGKVDRRRLPKPGEADRGDDFVGPGDEIEMVLVEVWADVLGIEKGLVGVDRNFFKLGGHSLKATIMVAKIQEQLGVRVPLAEVFKTPAIRDLSIFIRERLSSEGMDGASEYGALVPVEERDYYPVTPSQRRMFFLQQLERNNTGYNETVAAWLEGRIDLGQIKDVLELMVARHESLRTSFLLLGNEPVQRVYRKGTFVLEMLDKDREPGDAVRDFVRPFNVERLPLFRVALVSFSSERHLLILDAHHIIIDGTSLQLFVRECMALYAGEELPVRELQYRDFAVWFRGSGEPGKIAGEQYWLGQYGDEAPVLILPYDYARPPVQRFEGHRVHVELPGLATEQLNKFALEWNVTEFMVILAVYNVLLSRLSGMEDIIVGTAIAGRRHAAVQSMMGLFVNTLALRNYPGDAKTFAVFLEEIRNNTLQAFENQEYPFEELVERLDIVRDVSRNPLFSAALGFHNLALDTAGSVPVLEIPGIVLRPFDYADRPSKFDLTFHVHESNGQTVLTVEYSIWLFKETTIRRWGGYFIRILESVLHDPGQELALIDMMGEEEKKRLLIEFNDTDVEWEVDKNLEALFEEQVERTPDRAALVDWENKKSQSGNGGEIVITYKELNRLTDELAKDLINHGAGFGMITALKVRRSASMVIGILGILKAGGIYLPVDPLYPEERINYMLKDSAAGMVLEEDNRRGTVPVPVCVENGSGFAMRVGHGHRAPTDEQQENRNAYIIYTSGSTGRPKGVLVGHAGVVNMVYTFWRLLTFSQDARFSQVAGVSFDAAVFEIFPALLSGAPLVFPPQDICPAPGPMKNWLIKNQITVSFQPTAMAHQLLDQPWPQSRISLEILTTGGDRLTRYRTASCPFRFFNVYGLTEDSVWTTLYEVPLQKNTHAKPPSIGKPIPNKKIYILNRAMLPQPTGVPGEIYITGTGLAEGYLNRPELTAVFFLATDGRRPPAQTFTDGYVLESELDHKITADTGGAKQDHVTNNKSFAGGPGGPSRTGFIKQKRSPYATRCRRQSFYKTGDLGCWLEDGDIEFLGRIDGQVSVRGYRVELGEIEGVLVGFDGVRGAVVVGRKDTTGDMVLCAYVVSDGEGDDLVEDWAEELRDYLGRFLPGYMVPLYFVAVDEIPLTVNNKIDFGALPEPVGGDREFYEAPRTVVELKLVEIWASVLGIAKEGIGIDSDFFALGGHSLKATAVVSAVHKELGVELPLSVFFQGPTIKKLAGVIGSMPRKEYAGLERAEEREYYPLTPGQQRFFLLHQLEPGSVAYHMPLSVSLNGLIDSSIDSDKIERVFTALIRRHESLRTSFHVINGKLVQRIHEDVEFTLDRGGPSGFVRPFDLSQAPLVRAAVWRRESGDVLLMVDIHHIVADGMSIQVLTRDFRALLEEPARPLEPLSVRYVDFSQWLTRRLETGGMDASWEYWLRQLGGRLPVLELPLDFPRPAVRSTVGARYTMMLGHDVAGLITGVVRRTGTTLYMVMLAVYSILLSRYGGQDDIIVGSPIARRFHADLERVIGLVMGSVMLRTRPGGNKTFAGYLEEIKKVTLDAYEHQEYPFEELLKMLDVEDIPGHDPVSDVALIVQDIVEVPALSSVGNNEAARIGEHKAGTSKLDVTLDVVEINDGIRVTFEYCTALFKPGTVERMAGHFLNLLTDACTRPDRFLHDLDMTGDESFLPLSHPQYRIMDVEKNFPGSVCNTLAFTVLYKEKTNGPLLEQAINHVIRVNDGCRLGVVENEFHPRRVQVIEPYSYRTLETVDDDWIKDDLRKTIRVLDGAGNDLYYFALYKTQVESPGQGSGFRDGYYIKYHHLAGDGWSFFLIVREIDLIYKKLLSGNQPGGAPGFSYMDFVNFEREYLKSSRAQEDKKFWLDMLLPLPGPVRFWTPARNVEPSARVSLINIPEPLGQTIYRYCRDRGATVYKILLAGLSVFIARVSRSDDFVIGSAGHNRGSNAFRRTVGMFVATFPFRARLDQSGTFAAALETMAGQLDNIIKHRQSYPFDLLLEDIRKETGTNPGHLLDINLVGHGEWKDKDIGVRYCFAGDEPTPLAIHINDKVNDKDSERVIELEWVFQTSLFTTREIAGMHQCLVTILEQALQDPQKQLNVIELASPEEKRQILYEFNDGRNIKGDRHEKGDRRKILICEKTVVELFEEQVERTPDYVAVVGKGDRLGTCPYGGVLTGGVRKGDRRERTSFPSSYELRATSLHLLTYRELNCRSDLIAETLVKEGTGPGKIVAIMMERSAELITCLLGTLKSGAAYLPIEPGTPKSRVEYILKDSAPAVLLTPEKLEAKNSACPQNHQNHPGITTNSPAYIIYTSGTTGRPKGVVIEHRSLSNYLYAFQKEFCITSRDNVLQQASVAFDASVEEIYPALLTGARVTIVPNDIVRDIDRLTGFMIRHCITVTSMSPALLSQLNRMDPGTAVRLYISGGDVLKPGDIDNLIKKTAVYNTYGPTETTVCATYYRCTGSRGETIPIGRPVTGYRVYIVDRYYHLLPVGIPGEIVISGPGTATGYLNHPELTIERFLESMVNTLYKSGDLGRWLDDGNIEFLGRIDRQLNIRGYRVEPGEIESCLLGVDRVREAVVLDSAGQDGTVELSAYVVADGELTVERLRVYLEDRLPGFMVPSEFLMVERIPRTVSGKIDRDALAALETNRMESGKSFEEPKTTVEKKLARLWQEVLGIERAGLSDHFFHFGGHSLKAVALAARIHKTFDRKIPLSMLYRYPVLSEMAELLEKETRAVYTRIQPAPKKQTYPLSPAQERVFVLYRLGTSGTAYNITRAVIIEGTPDLDKFEAVFNALIKRHESLRTSFHLEEGEPVQRIHDQLQLPIQTIPAGSEHEQTADFVKPFDLSCPPLLRVGIQSIGPEYFLMIVDLHHIIADGMSIGILINQFQVLLKGGMDLTPLRLQYKDFAWWQRSSMEHGGMKQQEKWWLDTFKGQLPALQLPLDFVPPAVKDYSGRRIHFNLEEKHTACLKQTASRLDTSLYILMLGGFGILLSRLGGQDDIVIGTPSAGRRDPDLEPVVGMFVNTLALRLFPSPEQTVREFLAALKKHTVDAFENQDYPFEQLVNRVVKSRDTARHPLFDVMFALQENPPAHIAPLPKEPGSTGIVVKPFEMETVTSKFDLTLEAFDTGKEIRFAFEYCTALFKENTINRFAQYYLTIIKTISTALTRDSNNIEENNIKINQIDILPPTEKERILYDFNDTTIDFPSTKTLHELFETQTHKTPERIAIVRTRFIASTSLPTAITYRELNHRSNILSQKLKTNGLLPGDIAAVKTTRSIGTIIALLAILKTGAAYLPIDPELPKERIDYILNDSNPAVLLTIGNLKELNHEEHEGHEDEKKEKKEKKENIQVEYRKNRRDRFPTCPSKNSKNSACPQNQSPAYIIYTSGTTGKPKGVVVEHRSAVNVVTWFARSYRVKPGKHVLQMSDYTFDASVNQVFGTLLHGGVLHVIPKGLIMDLNRLRRYIDAAQVNLINFVPQHLKELLTDYPRLKSLEIVISGADRLDNATKEKILEKGYELYNHYGPTETTIDALAARCEPGLPVTLGKPIANTRCYILDPSGNLLPIGAAGELYISGTGVAEGYLNRPDLTHGVFFATDGHRPPAQTFTDGFVLKDHLALSTQHLALYKSGDLCRWTGDGRVEFLGRIDRQVKVRGYRIEPGEIEARMLSYPGINEAVVISRELRERAIGLCAYYTGDKMADSGDLKKVLSETLPGYMVPGHFVKLEKIPVTPAGKVDYAGLPLPAEIGKPRFVAPVSGIEKQIAEAWKEVLGTASIGVETNIFDIGGNSIDMIKISARLKEKWNIDIPVIKMFRYPTIRGMAGIKEHEPDAHINGINDRAEEKQMGKKRLEQMRKRRR